MADIIYFDSNSGFDGLSNDGTKKRPFKSLDYFVNNIAIKNGKDYIFKLGDGVYTLQQSTIQYFQNCTIEISGNRQNTVLKQVTGIFTNNVGGYTTLTLNCKRLIYNIDLSLTANNLNGFNWKWNFENVVFNEIPNNSYSVFSSASPMTIKNCVKVTNTTCFLRKNSTTISVIDSYGAFTSGYATSQTDWDISGNTIVSTTSLNSDFSRIDAVDSNGVYSGVLTWYKNSVSPFYFDKILISSSGGEVLNTTNMTVDTGDLCVDGIASALHYSAYAKQAFDDKISSSTSERWHTASGGVPTWIQYEFTKQETVNVVRIMSYYASGYEAIKDFTISGSNTGLFNGEQKLLYAGMHPNDITTSFVDYTFDNIDKYKFYRINISSVYVGNGNSDTSIVEIEMKNKYSISTIESFESSSENTFINYGMDNLTSSTIKLPYNKKIYHKSTNSALGSGKTFEHTIDLSRYKVNKIAVQ